ncbi:tRNA preQ1(34) S-adenosylmethionine ribosyltransferase-isomerase QueA [Lentisphaera marina]|uniref:tRNA preQ1(34) S-adenosylmethionine ribosyltransferase-isomerase QueA n=1 Tax=Lentisphaera marina TaxID=1111041 RepID=UPI0023669AD3|nr:tRNA preQ1(34) S-adenosylmethionine ribosyltransferase-isomerase QueA [Lentisphaera marina]MDD7984523.1 tRNA preQ1(34) S-adenosylmethionine ribosyltransferase-isomerase QueA [Lentisphaera marina]
MSTHLSDYNFHLPEELIAQRPPAERQQSRMMVIDRQKSRREIMPFENFPSFLRQGDLIIRNNTKVIPARLFGTKKDSGGKVQALLCEERNTGLWQAMLKPGRRLRAGTQILIENSHEEYFTVKEKLDDGTYLIQFSNPDVLDILDKFGHIPLPPYMNREDDAQDRKRYQTVFADQPGAVAAPTAGLHFTEDIFSQCAENGADFADVTLHTGIGTFQPVSCEDLSEHQMHSEFYELNNSTAEKIRQTKKNGGRIFAIGTTSVRTLETCADPVNFINPGKGKTQIFLYPPKVPQVTDCLLTNFHLPKSTLLMLVSTFFPREQVLEAYEQAVKEQMRFFSYGDCMLIV